MYLGVFDGTARSRALTQKRLIRKKRGGTVPMNESAARNRKN